MACFLLASFEVSNYLRSARQVVLYNVWNTLSSRGYQLENASKEHYWISKWDPSHTALTFSCLLSPLHVAILVARRYLGNDGKAQQEQNFVVMILAVFHGYVNLLLAHKFLQRESVNTALFRGVYNVEVNYRESQMVRRRQIEGEVSRKFGIYGNVPVR
jgi:hypothetical protein